ncbi:hypothetical protein HELRODRAFT_168522 [Helobdella robusta]|uniref:Uncharacterized protein n=1 Tax=Helobdella robusta TaxID=6412 RepID=T1F0N6_HELRO|nr:hypothetical protein HELRODRAFT_168522 [Helobdella robusta]ESO09526.1 hypothetical protein HELRODRAFT_168522 [Helobdella robusta]
MQADEDTNVQTFTHSNIWTEAGHEKTKRETQANINKVPPLTSTQTPDYPETPTHAGIKSKANSAEPIIEERKQRKEEQKTTNEIFIATRINVDQQDNALVNNNNIKENKLAMNQI